MMTQHSSSSTTANNNDYDNNDSNHHHHHHAGMVPSCLLDLLIASPHLASSSRSSHVLLPTARRAQYSRSDAATSRLVSRDNTSWNLCHKYLNAATPPFFANRGVRSEHCTRPVTRQNRTVAFLHRLSSRKLFVHLSIM